LYLRNGKIGVIDLVSRDVVDEKLGDKVTWDEMSSISIADELASEHGEDSLILGTGVLTGSFVPASCAGILRGENDAAGRRRLMPLMGFAGFELKLSGFDFVVIKGVAGRPSYLWIRDGMIDVVNAEELRHLDSWARTDKVRADQGDSKIQVIAGGAWCDSKHPQSQAVMDYWGGDDKSGLGAELGKKNLVAIAFRGMGELELAEPEGHFEDAILLMREHVVKLGENHGLASYSDVVDRGDFKKLIHRYVGCYGCPFPCRTYLKVAEDPAELRLVAKEPGYLHYDIPALREAFGLGLDAKDATLALMKCAKAGAEPHTVLKWASEISSKVTLGSVDEVLANPVDAKRSRVEYPPGNFEPSFDDEATYRACLGLGLCPRYWAKVGFDISQIGLFAKDLLGRSVPADGS
jgi:aldehyde:ferredoxin oxidoreductase